MKTLQQVNQKMDFSEDSIYVGIDVHKKQWSVFIMSDYKEHKGFVQPPDPGVLASYLKKIFRKQLIIVLMKQAFLVSGFTKP